MIWADFRWLKKIIDSPFVPLEDEIKQEYLNIAVGIAPGQVCVEMKGNAGAVSIDRCIVFGSIWIPGS